ncbi:ATP-binding protein [Rhodococcus sp. AB351]|uniref:ATP-binding protein n=1 Tax=Rhodococcus sp. AB351 TaxID=3413280 RepID=UPI003C13CB1E
MTANGIDRILNSPASERGRTLAAVGEDQWFERKSARVEPKKLAEALVAFANAEGGTVAVGLYNGKVEGTKRWEAKMNDLRQASIDHTTPPVRCDIQSLACVNDEGDVDKILVFRVDPGERVHEMKNGDCFLRVGDESRKLNYTLRRELEFDKGQSIFDGHPISEVTISDLQGPLLENYRDVTGASSDESILKARSLLTRDGKVTVAGYLLFSEHPQDEFPEAYIRVVRFLSNERGVGSRLNLDDNADIRIEGPIPTALQRAVDYIENLAPKRRRLDEGGTFTGQDLVPREAWLEGLVNAVIHRSYSLAGDHIRVEIYPNRIEIESPGRFPGLADPSRPLEISRYARNPRIARVCADLRLGQELGEGIKRIFDEMRRVGLTDPVYTQNAGSVRLRLEAVARLEPAVAARLPQGSQEVLDALRVAGGPMGTGELATWLDLTRPTVLKRLRALEEEGLIEWIGASPRDPRAVWALRTF